MMTLMMLVVMMKFIKELPSKRHKTPQEFKNKRFSEDSDSEGL